MNQSFDDYEVLVVDDRGKDNSIGIVEQMAETRPNGKRIRIVHHEKNLGTGGVRNTCIDNAEGEYILFMDGDDYLATNAIQLLYEASVNNLADIVMGNHQRVFPDGRIESTSHYKSGLCVSDYAIAQWMSNNQTNYYPVATWNKLFKVSFLRDNGIRCVPWHRQEDIYFALQTSFFVKTIVTIPEVTYYWVQVDGSCTHSETTEWHLKQYLDIFDKSMSLYNEMEQKIARKLPKELYWIITNRFLWGFITINICSSSLLSNKQKNSYLKHIREVSHHLKCCDEYNRRQQLIYLILFLPFPYQAIRSMLLLRSIF